MCREEKNVSETGYRYYTYPALQEGGVYISILFLLSCFRGLKAGITFFIAEISPQTVWFFQWT